MLKCRLFLALMAHRKSYPISTDIDKFYTPIAHGDQAALNYKVQTELLRVLENTGAFQSFLKEKKHDEITEQTAREDRGLLSGSQKL